MTRVAKPRPAPASRRRSADSGLRNEKIDPPWGVGEERLEQTHFRLGVDSDGLETGCMPVGRRYDRAALGEHGEHAGQIPVAPQGDDRKAVVAEAFEPCREPAGALEGGSADPSGQRLPLRTYRIKAGVGLDFLFQGQGRGSQRRRRA